MLSIIIVNWNSGLLLRACLDSIASLKSLKTMLVEAIVVDNGSVDHSLDLPDYPFELSVRRNERNEGFARGCNQGAALAKGTFLLFLNPDCALGPDSIDAALTTLRRDVDIGVVGVALSDDSGRIARSCHNFPAIHHFIGRTTGLARLFPRLFDSAMSRWPHDQDCDVDHVIGAFYMTRAELFRCLSGFDERFFVYLEDLDLSLRIRRAGFRIRFLAQPSTYHKGGGTSDKAKAARLFFATRSRIIYAFKHFTAVAAWGHLAVTLVVEPVCRVGELLIRWRVSEIGEVRRGFAMLLRDLPSIIRRVRQR